MTCHRCGYEDAPHCSRLNWKPMCDECHAAEEIRYDASISDPAINPCPKPKGGWQLGWSPPCEPQL